MVGNLKPEIFKLLAGPLLAFVAFVSIGQSIDYNSIILPESVNDASFEERLVRLAWKNNPSTKMLNHQVETAQIEVKQARWSFLNDFRVQGNINEFVLDESTDLAGRAAFFPKYNITGQVSLGFFVDAPLEVKKKKQQVAIAESTINQQKLALRAEVLTRYEKYLMNRESLLVQTEIVEDLFASLSLAEQQFQNGSIKLEEYNRIQDRYNAQKLRQINSQGDFNISKIELEELIGVKLENVL
ncbi:TolC family protein [Fulvivirga sp.]|uniref:TolC family protein n=1 Tax=Fulvivirga sp. TaxID=1931237 RepID=UPI0032EB4D0F